MDSERLDRVSSNLTKVSILLAVTGITLVYGTWFGPLKSTGETPSWIWKVASILVLYSSVKCFAINRYLGSKK